MTDAILKFSVGFGAFDGHFDAQFRALVKKSATVPPRKIIFGFQRVENYAALDLLRGMGVRGYGADVLRHFGQVQTAQLFGRHQAESDAVDEIRKVLPPLFRFEHDPFTDGQEYFHFGITVDVVRFQQGVYVIEFGHEKYARVYEYGEKSQRPVKNGFGHLVEMFIDRSRVYFISFLPPERVRIADHLPTLDFQLVQHQQKTSAHDVH